ncbi:hypothetical protein RJT34_25586 [Clitoria ternatea]|uniref:Uncharacterized protein n=1 Tax=Clitoria ternatea TaxID=43366 RepID=A0AAN9IIN0_CLITE
MVSTATPSKPKLRSQSNPNSSPAILTLIAPQTLPLRRSIRAKSLDFDSPYAPPPNPLPTPTRRSFTKNDFIDEPKKKNDKGSAKVSFAPISLEQSEKTNKRKREKLEKPKRDGEGSVVTRSMVARKGISENKGKSGRSREGRVYYKKVVYDGGEFVVGDDVYVKRRENASFDDEDPETKERYVVVLIDELDKEMWNGYNHFHGI